MTDASGKYSSTEKKIAPHRIALLVIPNFLTHEKVWTASDVRNHEGERGIPEGDGLALREVYGGGGGGHVLYVRALLGTARRCRRFARDGCKGRDQSARGNVRG